MRQLLRPRRRNRSRCLQLDSVALFDAREQRLRQEAGILVRSMAGRPLIDGSLRVSLGSSEQMRQFWAAYAAIEGLDTGGG